MCGKSWMWRWAGSAHVPLCRLAVSRRPVGGCSIFHFGRRGLALGTVQRPSQTKTRGRDRRVRHSIAQGIRQAALRPRGLVLVLLSERRAQTCAARSRIPPTGAQHPGSITPTPPPQTQTRPWPPPTRPQPPCKGWAGGWRSASPHAGGRGLRGQVVCCSCGGMPQAATPPAEEEPPWALHRPAAAGARPRPSRWRP